MEGDGGQEGRQERVLRGFPPGAPQDALGKAQSSAGFLRTNARRSRARVRLGGRVARWAGTRAAATAEGSSAAAGSLRPAGAAAGREAGREEKLKMGKGRKDGVAWGWVCR